MELQVDEKKIFAPLLDKWVKLTQEEKLKQEFIVRLINHYGYDLQQIGQDIEIQGKAKVDIAIWKNKAEKRKGEKPAIIIAVECRAEHISIKHEEFLLSYKIAASIDAHFFVAANLKEIKVYHIQQDSTTRSFEKLNDIPHANKIQSDKSLQDYINDTKVFTRDQFSKLLFRCHSIIRNNDKLSPESAFDEISKILFMKIMYEKKSKEELIFSLQKFNSLEQDYEETIRPTLKKGNPNYDLDYMQYQFDRTKANFEKDEIFDKDDRIKIRKNSFLQIVEELQAFNLSDTSDDVKGIAFEEFLGKTFRGELGQFFTPRTIVDYMVEVLDPQEGETICDPCCGSGGFLIKAFEYVREKIEHSIHESKEKLKGSLLNEKFKLLPKAKQKEFTDRVNRRLAELDQQLDINYEKGRLRKLSYDCIFGTDANPRMARTAKMNMIMHGDGHGGVHHHDGLINVNGVYNGHFDVILTNPPFGARVDKDLRITALDLPTDEKIALYTERYGSSYEEAVVSPLREWAAADEGKGTPILKLYEVGRWSGLTEVLFIERCLNLLRPGGRAGIVLPEGVLNTAGLKKVRDFVEGKARLINITSIPQDVFIASGATVKPSIVFFKKFTVEDQLEYKNAKREAARIVAERNKTPNNAATTANTKISATSNKKAVARNAVREESVRVKKQNPILELEELAELKRIFDYLIPVIAVEKAGISSTGAPTNNELIEAAKEFARYRKEANLWSTEINAMDYSNNNDEELVRVLDSIE